MAGSRPVTEGEVGEGPGRENVGRNDSSWQSGRKVCGTGNVSEKGDGPYGGDRLRISRKSWVDSVLRGRVLTIWVY